MARAKKESSASFNDVVAKVANEKSNKVSADFKTRLAAVQSAVEGVNKAFGAKTVMKMNDEVNFDFPKIPTGIMSVDLALGIGGVPQGRIIELFGDASSGKTTFALHLISEAQKAGGICAFVDAEHALDPSWAKKLGVNLDELYITQPNNGEEALQTVEAFVKSNGFAVIVVDSVAALVPKAELEGEIGDAHMALAARLMSQALRKLTALVSESKVILVFINQERATINSMPNAPKKTVTGGNALRFYASIRAQLARTQSLKKGEEAVGNCVQIKFVKNKVAPPFKVATFDIMFAGYINKEGSLLEEAEKIKVVKKSGSWFLYDGLQLGQGLDKSSEYLVSDTKVRDQIYEKVMEFYKEKAAKGAVALERRRAAAPLEETKDDSNENKETDNKELQDDNE